MTGPRIMTAEHRSGDQDQAHHPRTVQTRSARSPPPLRLLLGLAAKHLASVYASHAAAAMLKSSRGRPGWFSTDHRLWSAALLSIPGKGIRSATSACVPAPAVFYDAHPSAALVKGEFKLGNGRYCNPLTITDHASGFPAPVRSPGVDPRRPRLHGLRSLNPKSGPRLQPHRAFKQEQ